jgi:hypothetical protein
MARLRPRLQFARRAMSTGARSGLDWVLKVLGAVLLIVGLGVVGVALNRPAWALGGVAVLLIVLSFAEGSFREWRTSESERTRLDSVLTEAHSVDATVVRLEGFARECEQLKNEIPADPVQPAALPTLPQELWSSSAVHMAERIKSEIRMNAPGFLEYWNAELRPLPSYPAGAHSRAWADMAIEQLRHITARLKAGHNSP